MRRHASASHCQPSSAGHLPVGAMDPRVYLVDNGARTRGSETPRRMRGLHKSAGCCQDTAQASWAMSSFAMCSFLEKMFNFIRRDDEGQGVSEYAVLLVLLVVIVVSAVHAIGMNAQQVIDRVNATLQSLTS
jgi:Flp pilus assembly pilin Flp